MPSCAFLITHRLAPRWRRKWLPLRTTNSISAWNFRTWIPRHIIFFSVKYCQKWLSARNEDIAFGSRTSGDKQKNKVVKKQEHSVPIIQLWNVGSLLDVWCLLHVINVDECFHIVFGFALCVGCVFENPIFCLINLRLFMCNDNWNYAKQTESFCFHFTPFDSNRMPNTAINYCLN